jgi:LPS-assembly protein
VLLAAHAHAQTPELCPPLPPRPPLTDAADDKPQLSADRLVSSDGLVTVIEGDAVLTESGRRITADRIEVDRLDNTVTADGAVTFDNVDYSLSAQHLKVDLDSDDAVYENATYMQFGTFMQGRAARIEREAESRTHLHSATVSTCPAEKEDWTLTADRVLLDHETQQGTARGTVLRFKKVPLLYSPWFRFPIGDARQSGFLAPELSFSDSSGTEFSIPWYWNIAPQADATFTPRYMSERGTQLQNEVRLLTHQGRWQLDAEYLDDDKFGDERSFGRLRHSGTLGANWATNINAAGVSDKDYFDDLGNSLSIASITHLQRRGELIYYADGFSLLSAVEDYQTLDPDIPPSGRPYQRIPQFVLQTTPRMREAVDYGLTAEAVHFDRPASITGPRLDLRPYVNSQLEGAAWFFTPTLQLRYTQYELENTDPGQPASLERTLPIVSLDGGLFFERDAGALLQTLEPRLFYLYVPFEDQSNVPIFDTSEYTFSFAQLFRTNRFTGADRVGDANQLSVALSSRFLNPSNGAEKYSISAGQIMYFRDREVTLPGQPAATRPTSDAIVEGSAALSETLALSGALQYNPDTTQNDEGELQLQYRNTTEHIASLAYRYRRREDIEQLDASFKWQLTPSWSVLGRWYQSLFDNRLLEGLAGFQYESCCWLFRTVVRERIRDETDETENSIYLQLALKGLTSIGRDAGSLLESGILGYRENEDYQ